MLANLFSYDAEGVSESVQLLVDRGLGTLMVSTRFTISILVSWGMEV